MPLKSRHRLLSFPSFDSSPAPLLGVGHLRVGQPVQIKTDAHPKVGLQSFVMKMLGLEKLVVKSELSKHEKVMNPVAALFSLGLKGPCSPNPCLSHALLAAFTRVMCSSDGSCHAVVAWSNALDVGKMEACSSLFPLLRPAKRCKLQGTAILASRGQLTI